ncbi:MAG: hypothetical protein JWM72_2471 [Actinomycetia bacterium]|nr:hypothetical protein [Actinomycetes bacterium]
MRDRRVLLIVGCAALFAFGAAYYTSPARPGRTSAEGYYGWADQLNYRLEARALRDGVLPGIDYNYDKRHPQPSYDARRRPLYDYSYGLGYPLLAVPTTFVGMRSDPFALPDALIFVAEIVIVFILGTRLRSLAFGLLAAGALAFATPLLDFTVLPWNTSVTTLAILVALLVATDPDEHPVGHGVALGVAVGVCFAARYVDAVFPAAIGTVGLLSRRPRALRPLLGAAALTLALAIPVLWSHAVVFGSPLTTPYAHHERDGTNASDQSLGAFDPGRAPRSFVEDFVTGEYNGARTQGRPMLAAFPWAVFAPVGLFALFRERRPGRLLYAVAAGVSVVGSAFYLSFWAGTGRDLAFYNLRYFVMWVPLWALLSVYGVVFSVERMRRDSTEGSVVASDGDLLGKQE